MSQRLEIKRHYLMSKEKKIRLIKEINKEKLEEKKEIKICSKIGKAVIKPFGNLFDKLKQFALF